MMHRTVGARLCYLCVLLILWVKVVDGILHDIFRVHCLKMSVFVLSVLEGSLRCRDKVTSFNELLID